MLSITKASIYAILLPTLFSSNLLNNEANADKLLILLNVIIHITITVMELICSFVPMKLCSVYFF